MKPRELIDIIENKELHISDILNNVAILSDNMIVRLETQCLDTQSVTIRN